MSTLSTEEKIRYARHLSLPQVGVEGQEKLSKAKILVIGAGGLGSPALLYLAAAGVGTIGIVDNDVVEESNLQRQILYNTEEKGLSKAEQAKEKIKLLNPYVSVEAYNERLTSTNALDILKQYDVIVDGSDNFPTRYLANDACVILGKPLVYGAIFQFDGQASVFNFDGSCCYRCLFPNPPPRELVPNCAEAGVLGVLPGVIGSIQATEALKIVLGKGKVLADRLFVYDALNMNVKELNLKKSPSCPVCSENASITELIDYEAFCNSVAGDKDESDISVQDLKKMIDDKNDDFVLIDIREAFEQDLGVIDGAKTTSFVKTMNGNLDAFDSIEPDKKIVLYCHTGQRSKHAQKFLSEKGFKNVFNVVGGIDAWSKEIDGSIPVY